MNQELFDEKNVEGMRNNSPIVIDERTVCKSGDKVEGSANRMINKLDDFTVGPDGTIILNPEDQMKMIDYDIQLETLLKSNGLDEKQIGQFKNDLTEMEKLMKSENHDEVFSKVWGKFYGGSLEKADSEKMADFKKFYEESGYSFVYLVYVLNDLKIFEKGPNKKNIPGPGFVNDKYWEKYDPKNFQRVFNNIKGLLGDGLSDVKEDDSEKLLQFWTFGDLDFKNKQIITKSKGMFLILAMPSLNGVSDSDYVLLQEMKKQLYDYGKTIIKEKQADGVTKQKERELLKENIKEFINDIGENKTVVVPEGKDFYEMVVKYKH